jgi:hypothetical protein
MFLDLFEDLRSLSLGRVTRKLLVSTQTMARNGTRPFLDWTGAPLQLLKDHRVVVWEVPSISTPARKISKNGIPKRQHRQKDEGSKSSLKLTKTRNTVHFAFVPSMQMSAPLR